MFSEASSQRFGHREGGGGRASSFGDEQDSQFEVSQRRISKDLEYLSRNVSSIRRMLEQVGTTSDCQDLREDLYRLLHLHTAMPKLNTCKGGAERL